MKPEKGGGDVKIIQLKISELLFMLVLKKAYYSKHTSPCTHLLLPPFPVLSPLKQNCIENIQIMHKILVRVSFLIWRHSVYEKVPFWLWLHIA